LQTPSPYSPTGAVFATTQWSIVYAAAQTRQPGARDALAQLCSHYWAPLYAFARRQGLDPHNARDLVQGFFESLLASRTYTNATPARGRFRTFLIGGLRHYQGGVQARAGALKRGGGSTIIPLDENVLEDRYAAGGAALSPEKAYERQWALAVIDHTLAGLRAEFDTADNGAAFNIMLPFLTGDPSQSYDDACRTLGATLPAFKAQVHRLRLRFRAHLRREIAGTVDSPLEIDSEMRHLREILASS
jgi:RNA polymerase sigma-70 factor (ECF subfamily)